MVCPTDEMLRNLFRNDDLTSSADTLTHLKSCSACQQRMSQWDSPSRLEELLQSAGNSDIVIGGMDPVIDDLATNAYRVNAEQQIGQYVLLRSLGQGGGGEVFEARHRLLRRRVAVKLMAARHSGDPLARQRFFREMESIGKLHHPHVVHAYDAGESDGVLYLAMELVDGENVELMARRRGVIPIAEACEIVRQAALGLQHIWETGLVHRDLKPSNLLMSASGIKIADLGLALLRHQEPEDDRLTGERTVLGTADYMAPEQAEGSRDVDIRADLYSLGCTLFRLLAGRPPFAVAENTSPLRKLWAHASDPIPDVRQLRPDVPVELAELVRTLLAKSREDRPAEPRLLAESLEPFCASLDPSQIVSSGGRGGIRTGSTSRDLTHPRASSTAYQSLIEQTRQILLTRWGRVAVLAALAVCLVLIIGRGLSPGLRAVAPIGGATPAPLAAATIPAAVPEAPTAPAESAQAAAVTPVLPAAPLNAVERQWKDIFQQMPVDLPWPGRSGAATLRLDEGLEALVVVAPQSLRLMKLGDLAGDHTGDIQIATAVSIHSRLGNFGYFFGFHILPENHRQVIQFQGIEVDLLESTATERSLLVRRCLVGVDRESGSMSSQNNHHERVTLPAFPEELTFHVALRDDLLTSVRLSGTDCPELCSDRMNTQFPRTSCTGPFGLYVYGASAEFRKPFFQRAMR